MAHVSPQQVSPGDEITADSVNVPINQIAAQLNGNIDDSNISSISGSKIAAGTVPESALVKTPKFYTGFITFSAGTGSKAITAIGFRPKWVMLELAMNSSNTSYSASGTTSVDASNTIQKYAVASAGSTSGARSSRGGYSVLAVSVTATVYQGDITSFDDQGFTINIATDDSSFRTWKMTAWG